MRKIFVIFLSLLLILSACGTPDTPNTPSEKQNIGGFIWGGVLLQNGQSSAEYPEFDGLDGAADMNAVNRLIKGDAVAIFKSLTESDRYTGTFLDVALHGDILTVLFYGTYERDGEGYTVQFYGNYDIKNSRRVSIGELVEKSALEKALSTGDFSMPEDEYYSEIWKNQADYIKQNAGEILSYFTELTEPSNPDAGSVLPLSLYNDGNKIYMCVSVPHTLYDYAKVVLFESEN